MSITQCTIAMSEDANELPWTDEESDAFYTAKDAALTKLLGESADVVGHAIISFEVGGNVDMYYYPNHLPGTVFATQELLDPIGEGPIPNQMGTYELVSCTKLPYDANAGVGEGPWGTMERRICSSLSWIGHFSFEAKLEPGETIELPYEQEPHRYFVLDEFRTEEPFEILGKEFGLLLVIELFESEMRYSMKNGSVKLLNRLRKAGHYPYSDLDRDPVA